MNVIARPARLQSGKSVTQPIPNTPWGQQASVLLGLTHSLILFENLECRTTPPYFIFKNRPQSYPKGFRFGCKNACEPMPSPF